MNKNYIYIGIALAILVVMLLVFKPEFSMITGTTNPNSYIMSITPSGDLVLSDNTVKNINDYIDKMKSDLATLINTEKTQREADVNSLRSSLEADVNSLRSSLQPKGDYLTNGTRVAIRSGVTSGCGQGTAKFLLNGCGSQFNTADGKRGMIAALMTQEGPKPGPHVDDRTWLLQRY